MGDERLIATAPPHFLAKVDRSGSCWLWTAATDPDGYGRFRFDGENRKAPRVAYALAVGHITDGLCVLHRCDNPRCVRPSHLFVGSRQDNNLDRTAKGRDAKGVQLPQSKLTPAAVSEIHRRLQSGEPQVSIAHAMGVSKATICEIKKGRYWRHVAV